MSKLSFEVNVNSNKCNFITWGLKFKWNSLRESYIISFLGLINVRIKICFSFWTENIWRGKQPIYFKNLTSYYASDVVKERFISMEFNSSMHPNIIPRNCYLKYSVWKECGENISIRQSVFWQSCFNFHLTT